MLPLRRASPAPRVRPGSGRGSRRPVMARVSVELADQAGLLVRRYRHWSCVRKSSQLLSAAVAAADAAGRGLLKWRGCQWNWRNDISADPCGLELGLFQDGVGPV